MRRRNAPDADLRGDSFVIRSEVPLIASSSFVCRNAHMPDETRRQSVFCAGEGPIVLSSDPVDPAVPRTLTF